MNYISWLFNMSYRSHQSWLRHMLVVVAHKSFWYYVLFHLHLYEWVFILKAAFFDSCIREILKYHNLLETFNVWTEVLTKIINFFWFYKSILSCSILKRQIICRITVVKWIFSYFLKWIDCFYCVYILLQRLNYEPDWFRFNFTV